MIKILLLIILNTYALLPQKNFKVEINGNEVEVIWAKSSLETDYFVIERKSAQVNTWREIAKIDAKWRNNFSYKESNLSPETFYYKVKAVNNDGTHKYSKVREADLNKPFRFSLNQNYPNPFNPETIINYSISDNGYVDLRVYNLLGQEIKVLVSEYQEAGEYMVNFNASELNSGLYIYKLIAGNQVLTRKMTLIK